jgi:hypothetical protein
MLEEKFPPAALHGNKGPFEIVGQPLVAIIINQDLFSVPQHSGSKV